MRLSKTATSLSVSGASGEPGEGFRSARTMSFAAAMTMSVDDAVGMVTVVGNQTTVSEIRSARVAVIQTL